MRGRRFLSRAAVVTAAALVAVGCSGDSGDTDPTAAPRSQVLGDFETVVSGLEVPWAIAFVDASTLLVTERPGRVRIVRDGQLVAEPALELDVAREGEAGLLGIALHPDFPSTRAAYLYFTAAGENRVARFDVGPDLDLTGETAVFDGIPAAQFHDGGRIGFGPDGMLYVATGDARDPDRAAERSSLAGKLLRITPDGSVPDDNPFEGSPVYSYGHRNPQGFDWGADGNLYASEHGPSGDLGLCCHDEVNLIEQGGYYGWPFRAGTVRAMRGTPPREPVDPIAASGDDTWAPAGLAVWDGEGDSLLVATLRGEQLLRFVLDAGDRRSVTSTEVVLDGVGRLRAVVEGPDECIYVTTSNTDGRGDPRPDDDRILRTCPTPRAHRRR